MKVGLFQYNIAWENKDKNKSNILSILDASNESDIDWMIFPEMTLSGFSMDLSKTSINEADVGFFSKLAVDHNCNISFGAVVDSNNRNITINRKGDVICEYSKIHLFGYGDETSHYEPGKCERPFEIEGARIKPLVCYDLRFSYLFWDNAPKTDIFFVIANWAGSRRTHWMSLLKARAIENQSFVIGVNRVGSDPKVGYTGDSMVVDPQGNEILNCGDKEGLYTVRLSLDAVSKTRASFPFLKDRLK
ncbi:MAG: nitrilase-related carbon-nitrogen hydrolase [bacterium]